MKLLVRCAFAYAYTFIRTTQQHTLNTKKQKRENTRKYIIHGLRSIYIIHFTIYKLTRYNHLYNYLPYIALTYTMYSCILIYYI